MVSFLPKQGGNGQQPPAMLKMLLNMPGVGESIAQFGAFASGIMQSQQRIEQALVEILQRQERIMQRLDASEKREAVEEASNG